MRVYIVRHGESENNLKKVWTGWFNAPLTERGKEDAIKAGKLLGEIRFDKIYASDLDRARMTAEIALPGRSYETSELLREINVGTLANKPSSVLSSEQRASMLKDGYKTFDGETKIEFQARISKFMKKIELLDCENVAVFCHAGWLRGFLDEVIGITLPRKNICCNNCAVAIFEYTDENWRLYSWINLT